MNSSPAFLAPPRPIVTLVLLLLAVAAPTWAQGGLDLQQAEMRLLADQTEYEPGTVARIAAEVMVEPGWHVNSHAPLADYLIATELAVASPKDIAPPEIRYPEHELQTFSFSPDPVAVYDGTFHIFVDLLIPDGTSGELPLAAELTYQACDDNSCAPPTTAEAEIELRIGSGGKPQHGRVFGTSAGTSIDTAGGGEGGIGGRSLPWILVLAVFGGLILNAMPCVLPVLSLKIFSLMKAAHQGRSHLVSGALATTAGIVVSFWALALAAIVAARAGAAVGWGIQFQQPGFVTFLAVVVVLFSLNMWGLFEIPLPQRLARIGSDGGAREGLAGHFVAGLFATLMATPCSAPFLGTAVGFALVQPPIQIFLVFTAIGVGLALPYLALAVAPGLAKLLPKPGAWMDAFRQVLGFLLAAAAVWLFYVLSAQISAERLAFVQLSLLAMALSVWAMAKLRGRPTAHRVAALTVVVFCIVSVYLAVGAPARAANGVEASALLDWRPFDEAQAAALAESGTPVFVDFTADWCLTCKANERAVIETEATARLFAEHGVAVMKGDWTNRDDVITEFLARHGRAAVPFYILYRPGGATHVFGEVLTRGAIAEALGTSS